MQSSTTAISPPSFGSTTSTTGTSDAPSFSSSWPPETLTISTEGIINKCEEIEMGGLDMLSSQPFVLVIEMAALLYSDELIHAKHLWNRWKDSVLFDNLQAAAAAAGDSGGEQPTQQQDKINYKEIFAQWWNVGKCMIDVDCTNLWNALKVCIDDHPPFLKVYAKEVMDAFRYEKILKNFAVPQLQSISLLPSLGFDTENNLCQYLQEKQWALHENGTTWIAPLHILTAKTTSQTSSTTAASAFLSTATSSSTQHHHASSDLTQIVSFLESAKLNA